jgi:hypothetical protein
VLSVSCSSRSRAAVLPDGQICPVNVVGLAWPRSDFFVCCQGKWSYFGQFALEPVGCQASTTRSLAASIVTSAAESELLREVGLSAVLHSLVVLVREANDCE